MTLSIGSVFQPLNDFFLARFGTPEGAPVVFRFDKFGSVVSQDDFRANPADPASPFSPAVAREKISDLVNRVPAEVGDGAHVVLTADPIDSYYHSMVLRQAEPYLPAGTTAAARRDLITGFNLVRADALKRWENSELTSVLGSPLEVHATDTSPSRWWDPAESAVWTRHALTIHDTPRPSLNEPVVWRTLPSDAQLAEVMKAAQVRRAVSVTARVTDRLQPVQALRRREDDGLGTVVSELERSPRQNLRLRELSLDARTRLLLRQRLDRVAPKEAVSTDSVDISFEYCVVTLTRSWWSALVNAPTWKIPGYEQGSLNAAGVPGALRQLPVGFVAVRNVSIKAGWSDTDRARLAGAMSWGPFDVSSSLGSSEVAQPGLQIIGWLLQGLPALPPNPPADGPAAAEPSDKPSGRPVPAKRTHRVRRGDTLTGIAEKYYGDADKYKRIQQANKIKNAASIRVGQLLVIP